MCTTLRNIDSIEELSTKLGIRTIQCEKEESAGDREERRGEKVCEEKGRVAKDD